MRYTFKKPIDIIDVRSDIVGKTYALLSVGLFLASFFSYLSLGLQIGLIGSIFLMLLSIGLILAASKYRHTEWGLPLYFGFIAIIGFMMGPMINHYLNIPHGSSIVMKAIITTAIATTGLTVYAFKAKRSFNQLGGFLFVGLIIILVGGLANIFFRSPIFDLVLAGMGALIFSGYILFDTSRLLSGDIDSPIVGAITLFMNILNLFTSLLRLFSGTSND